MTVAVGGVLLVVDEDVQRVETLERLLSPDAITVLHARSTGQAIELLQALGTACCVLVSMTMPARGAWTLLSRLRNDRIPEHACAVVLMGPKSLLDSEPRNPPVIAKVPTPVDYAELCEILRDHCAPKLPSEEVRTA